MTAYFDYIYVIWLTDVSTYLHVFRFWVKIINLENLSQFLEARDIKLCELYYHTLLIWLLLINFGMKYFENLILFVIYILGNFNYLTNNLTRPYENSKNILTSEFKNLNNLPVVNYESYFANTPNFYPFTTSFIPRVQETYEMS